MVLTTEIFFFAPSPCSLLGIVADVGDDSAGSAVFFIMFTVIFRLRKRAILVSDIDAILGKYSFPRQRR